MRGQLRAVKCSGGLATLGFCPSACCLHITGAEVCEQEHAGGSHCSCAQLMESGLSIRNSMREPACWMLREGTVVLEHVRPCPAATRGGTCLQNRREPARGLLGARVERADQRRSTTPFVDPVPPASLGSLMPLCVRIVGRSALPAFLGNTTPHPTTGGGGRGGRRGLTKSISVGGHPRARGVCCCQAGIIVYYRHQQQCSGRKKDWQGAGKGIYGTIMLFL
eukprot:1150897-Pelagomonas_calceolata.AAC.8